MTDKELLIELLYESDLGCNQTLCVECDYLHFKKCKASMMADHLMSSGLVFRDQYEDMEERIAHQRSRAQYAEDFVCKLCAECEWEENDGIATMIKKCCNWFPECEQFKLRSRWIPVTERLPEDDRQVLACTRHGKAFSAHYDHKWKSWSVSHTVKITHWMPLPEMPKEVDNA